MQAISENGVGVGERNTRETRIRFTSKDWDGGNVEASEMTIGEFADVNDPDNEEVADAVRGLLAGGTYAELSDQASVYTIEVLTPTPKA